MTREQLQDLQSELINGRNPKWEPIVEQMLTHLIEEKDNKPVLFDLKAAYEESMPVKEVERVYTRQEVLNLINFIRDTYSGMNSFHLTSEQEILDGFFNLRQMGS